MRENPSWIVVSQNAAADIGVQALVPAVILTTMAMATVGLRWWSRVKMSGLWGVEDGVVTGAVVCLVVLMFMCIFMHLFIYLFSRLVG